MLLGGFRFAADADARTQEFVLRWAGAAPGCREVVRRQWNFAGGSAEEVGDDRADLAGVIEPEFAVTPDVAGGESLTTLAELRVA